MFEKLSERPHLYTSSYLRENTLYIQQHSYIQEIKWGIFFFSSTIATGYINIERTIDNFGRQCCLSFRQKRRAKYKGSWRRWIQSLGMGRQLSAIYIDQVERASDLYIFICVCIRKLRRIGERSLLTTFLWSDSLMGHDLQKDTIL